MGGPGDRSDRPGAVCFRLRRLLSHLLMSIAFNRPGSDLLSRVLRRSTIGAGVFHGRVRNGNGCSHPAMTTRSIKGNVPTARPECVEKLDFSEHRRCLSSRADRDLPVAALRTARRISADRTVVLYGCPARCRVREPRNEGDGLFEHVRWSLRFRIGALVTHTGR